MPSLLREKAVKDQPYPVNEEDLADKLRGPGEIHMSKDPLRTDHPAD